MEHVVRFRPASWAFTGVERTAMAVLENAAAMERYKRFMELNKQGIVEWDFWPLSSSCLTTLVKASHGILLRKTGVPIVSRARHRQTLEEHGWLEAYRPTMNGYKMLERFAPRKACFPVGYQSQWRASSADNGTSSDVQPDTTAEQRKGSAPRSDGDDNSGTDNGRQEAST